MGAMGEAQERGEPPTAHSRSGRPQEHHHQQQHHQQKQQRHRHLYKHPQRARQVERVGDWLRRRRSGSEAATSESEHEQDHDHHDDHDYGAMQDVEMAVSHCGPDVGRSLLSGSWGHGACEGSSLLSKGTGLEDGEVTAFEEYNVADIDSLEIAPSQDFGGDRGASSEEDTEAPGPSSQWQSSGWVDFRDGTQFGEEEASEVFDNVIYAPSAPNEGSARQTIRSLDYSHVTPLAVPIVPAEPETSARVIQPNGFDPVSKPSECQPSPSSHIDTVITEDVSKENQHSRPPPPQWKERLSVKRDCSFIDGSDCRAKSSPPMTSRIAVEDLQFEVLGSSDEFEHKLKLCDDPVASTATISRIARPQTQDPSQNLVETTCDSPSGFHHRRLKPKRRKVRQLALDGFFQPRPCT